MSDLSQDWDSSLTAHIAPSKGSNDAVGNLAKVIDSVMGTWTYNYDTLNRALNGTVGAQYACWSYDTFGNRTSESMSSTACNNNPPQLSWAHYTTSNSNRMDATSQNAAQSSGYDKAGNVLFDGVSTYVYDGEGRICAVKSEPIPGTYVMTEYIYDSQGNRVGKGTITTLSCNKSTNGFVAKAGYVTGLNGEQMTETNGTPQWVHTNVFANGSLIATYHDTSLYFSFEDWLGTKRAEGGVLSGGTCLNTYYSLPFGNDLTTTGTCPDATEHHFTQKERDPETGEANGNDYFGARYYTSTFGRFMSPDWTAKEEDDDPVPYAVLDDPQSLNLYAYVRNNPLVRVDVDGHSGLGPGEKYWQALQNLFSWQAHTQPNATQQQGSQTRSSNGWVNPTGGKVRGCDKGGCGYYGAPRNEGLGQKHLGTDYLGTPGQNVLAIHDGTITGVGDAYRGDQRLQMIDIKSPDGFAIGEGYVAPGLGMKPGVSVSAGQVIGTMQNVQVRTGPDVSPHVHIQIRNGSQRINPETLIPTP